MLYLFENGKFGLTPSLLKKGKAVFVINSIGEKFAINNWIASKTFRLDKQQNLIVSDNQTREYEYASIEKKKLLTRLAWGIHE